VEAQRLESTLELKRVRLKIVTTNASALRCVPALILIGLLSACGGSADIPTSATSSIVSKTQPASITSGVTSIAFATAYYTVQQTAGSVTVTATRSGSSGAAASVSYATANGTATAGQNFTAQSGTLIWAAGDATARNIVVPFSSTTIGNAINFSVTLSDPNGATLGSPASTLVTITPAGSISVAVSGNNLIDAQGNQIQLRGVNVSGLEGSSFDNDPWRAQKPNFAAMKTWGINVVRLPLAEANWLGLCSTTLNAGVTPAVYESAIQTAVSEANALGIYVILDLHIIAVPNLCPNGQNAMADTTYSAKFWGEVATAFKGNPAVMFELFNEPQGNYPPTTNDWNNYITGGLTGPQDTGAQQLLDAIRGAGATNVVLVDTLDYASTFGNNNPSKTGFTDNAPGFYLPADTLSTPQLVAVQHYYNAATKYEQGANVVLNKDIPIMLTEYGDEDGTTNDTTAVFGWADPGGRASQALTSGGASFPGVSYVAWTWNSGYGSWSLISDSNGDLSGSPYAAAVKAHYQSRAGL
jgi:aryl-phospho-beta-D-glucosidase BglC (GH1 family)